ncbi:MAG: TRAP transporter small permease [Hydrogenophaga sp.]|uniref:TRAP transporter small permease n=1 Tax=Hydrogenophaga sp. TaxID=1904254 RepID=UPI00260486F1|nr:TRAP transporter small permease [Hydrogenophaga sp.]MCW5668345.1 TRAP transporter small permease [Hydrogenophaga sp.]
MIAQATGGRTVRALEAIGAVALLVLMVTVFIDVVGRNLFNAPLPWGTELLEMVLALMIFAIYPLLAIGFGHITVDLIQLPERMHKVQRVLGSAIGAVVFALIAWCMVRQALRAASYGEATPLLGVPLSWVLGGIGAMAVVSTLAFLLAAARSIRPPRAPAAPHATEVI